MDKLLVIIVTRDWAERGGPLDEFCVNWLQPPAKDYAWFPGESLDLHLVHGYRGFNSAAAVQEAIETHARGCTQGRSYCACVVLQHFSSFQIDCSLIVKGSLPVVQVQTYGTVHGTVEEALDRAVSTLSRRGRGTLACWKEEFRRISPAVARDRMAQLIHAIVHLFLPVEVDFSGLRGAPDEKSRRDYAAEILRTWTEVSYEVRLQKLRFWVAKVEGDRIADQDRSLLPNGQCFLELVKTCGLGLEDESVQELIALCGLLDEGGKFAPPEEQRYFARGEGEDDPVRSFFQDLDQARQPEALIQRCWAKVQDDLDFLSWFDKLRGTLESLHDKILPEPRGEDGEV